MGLVPGILLMSYGNSTYAQPQYAINFMTSVTPSDIPFNSTTNNKSQWVFYNTDFVSAPSGNITRIYFRKNFSMLPVINTYTNLVVKMGETNLTTLPPGPWITANMTTVFQANSYDFIPVPVDWMPITLQTPFFYSGNSNFIVEVSHGGYSVGFQVMQANLTARSLYGGSGSLMANSQNFLCEFGFDIGVGGTDVSFEGISGLSDTICSGFKPVAAIMKNNGPATLTTTTINWKINNLVQPVNNWTGSLAANATTQVTLGNYNFLPSTAYDMVIWSTNPNNQADMDPSNDTLHHSILHCHPTPGAAPSSPSYSICIGDSVYVNGTLTGYPPWSMVISDGTNTYNLQNLITPVYGMYFNPTSNISYTVMSVTDATGCTGTGFPPSLVIVNPKPTVDLGPDQTIRISDSITLTAGTASGSYNWSTGATGNSIVVSGSQYGAGTHPFSVTVTNTYGCSARDTVWITVIDDTGIEEPLFPAVRIFPNPANTAIHIDLLHHLSGECLIEIITPDGRIALSAAVHPQESRNTFDTESLSDGIYFVRITGSFGILTQKLIVKR